MASKQRTSSSSIRLALPLLLSAQLFSTPLVAGSSLAMSQENFTRFIQINQEAAAYLPSDILNDEGDDDDWENETELSYQGHCDWSRYYQQEFSREEAPLHLEDFQQLVEKHGMTPADYFAFSRMLFWPIYQVNKEMLEREAQQNPGFGLTFAEEYPEGDLLDRCMSDQQKRQSLELLSQLSNPFFME